MKLLSRTVLLLAVACLLLAVALPVRAAEPSAAPTAPITGYVTEEKVIFLTFDDGPFAPWTQQIVDELAKWDAKATFFVIGRQAAADPAILKTIYDAGHGLGNHGYNHANLSGASRDTFASEIGLTADTLGDMDSHCMRPPYGAVDSHTLSYAQEYGYTVIKWNMDPRDWDLPGARAIANHVISHAQPGSIVVMHDGGGDRSQTVAALDILIPRLQRQGYSFKALCRDVTPEQLVEAAIGKPTETPAPVETYVLTPAPTPTFDAAATPAQRTALRAAAVRASEEEDAPATPTPAASAASVAPARAEASPTPTPTAPTAIYGSITFPRAASTVRGVILVQGSADHPAFEKWQLDLVLDNGEEIFLAMSDQALPAVGKLAVWDTRLYPDGAAMLRLRVVHEGNYEEYFTHLTIAN